MSKAAKRLNINLIPGKKITSPTLIHLTEENRRAKKIIIQKCHRVHGSITTAAVSRRLSDPKVKAKKKEKRQHIMLTSALSNNMGEDCDR